MKKIVTMLGLITLLSLTGCYRMPTDDDCCMVPSTNNPHYTGSANHSTMPGFGG